MSYEFTTTTANPADIMAILAPMMGALIVGAIIGYIIAVIPMWKQFTKAGEAGWKALIPIYNTYTAFKLFYKTKMFWAMLIAEFVAGFLTGIVPVLGGIVSFGVGIFTFIVIILYNVNKSKSFGHSGAFAVGLILLSIIFEYILAFDGSVYKKIEE